MDTLQDEIGTDLASQIKHEVLRRIFEAYFPPNFTAGKISQRY
jgi:hypothetical protein